MRKKNILKAAGVLLIAIAMLSSSIAIANTNEKELQTMISNPQNEIKESQTKEIRLLEGPIIWDNGGTTQDSNGYSSQLERSYPFVSQCADDFLFEEDTDVYDVHWFGVFWNGPPDEVDPCAFNIYFYKDNGSGFEPTGGGMADPAPTAIATYNFAAVTGYPLDPNGFYSYSVDLDPPFHAVGGEKYWIAIQAEFTFPPQWGWCTTNAIRLMPAVQGFPLLGITFWTMIDPETDLAWYLTGKPEPCEELGCEGELYWNEEGVPPGSTQRGQFKVANVGCDCSVLCWEIIDWPDWGNWTFIPPSGSLHAPDSVIVDVSVVAPPYNETAYTGKIIVKNCQDPDEICTIPVYLKTPKTKEYNRLPFLQMLFERFPNAFPILRQLLGM
jgi:hypothetical protein